MSAPKLAENLVSVGDKYVVMSNIIKKLVRLLTIRLVAGSAFDALNARGDEGLRLL